MKTYTIQIFKSYHRIKVFDKTYPDPHTPLHVINCWTNSNFKTMQEVYEYQRKYILRTCGRNDMYLIMRKNGKVIEPKVPIGNQIDFFSELKDLVIIPKFKSMYKIDLTLPQVNKVQVIDPEGNIVTETDNELLFDSIRLQISRNRLTEFKVKFQDEEVEINDEGKITPKWPSWLFGQKDKFLSDLFKETRYYKDVYKPKFENKN